MADTRRYPDRPFVGVGAVIVHDGRVVLVRRKYDPLAGQWSIPGGAVDVGETLEASVAREMREETGLEIEVGPVIEVFDRITRDEDGRVRYHFVLVDYLCRPMGGVLQAGSDVAEVALADPADLAAYSLTAKATAVIERAMELERVGANQTLRSPVPAARDQAPSPNRETGEPGDPHDASSEPAVPNDSSMPNVMGVE